MMVGEVGPSIIESEEKHRLEEEAFGDLGESDDQSEAREQQRKDCVRALTLLEDAFTDPIFLQEVSDFIAKHALTFDDRQEDHPIQWMLLWNEYKGLISRNVEGLMKKEGLCEEEIAGFCEWIADEDPQALVCVDYLLACVEYQAFLELMLQHKELLTCEPMPYIPEGRPDPMMQEGAKQVTGISGKAAATVAPEPVEKKPDSGEIGAAAA